jgi:uncharacterized membrane protein YeaQ/YmgE (transglycosylase-associated protein family)
MPNRTSTADVDSFRVALWTPVVVDASVLTRRSNIMPDLVNLIVWLVAGVAGGNAAGDLLKGDYDLGPGNTVAGAIGGVAGAFILQFLIPALRGIDYGSIIGQLIVAAASGAALTVIAAAVQMRKKRR